MNHDQAVEPRRDRALSAAAFVGLSGDAKKDEGIIIGQFGVGFYSAFMVADRVEVLSRKAGEEQGWRWESDGKGEFTIEPEPNLKRGTRITLHIREGDEDYLEPLLRQIVKTYSSHIALRRARQRQQGRAINTSALWTRPRSRSPEPYKFYHHVGRWANVAACRRAGRRRIPYLLLSGRSRSACSTERKACRE